MRRLLWKEAREQLWFALAALASPVVLAAFRLLLHATWTWPQDHGDVVPIYAVFVIWGAWTVSGEREHGRLTLSTIPVPRWQIWLAKILPALPVAILTAALTAQIGNAQGNYLTPGLMAAACTLCFSAAFLLGIALSAPVAALLSGFVVSLGMCAVNLATKSEPYADRSILDAAVAEPLIWAEIAFLLLAAFVAISWRGGIPSPRKARWPVALGALLVAVPGVWSLVAPSRHHSDTHDWFANTPLVSRATGWVAFADGFPRDWPPRRRNPALYSNVGLWVMRLDGSARGLVSDKVMPQPVVWLGTGELLYVERDVRTQVDRYLTWSPRSGRSRTLLSERIRETANQPWVSAAVGWESSWYAAEPGGTRFACLRKSKSHLPSDGYDLWVVDSATGKSTLLAPWVDAICVYWRAGRIYTLSDSGPKSISPSGGPLRNETHLPPPDKEESR